MDPAALAAATVYANATQNAFVVLVKCLTDNGALKPGQFSTAIKSSLSEANQQHLDYQFFQGLSRMLDETETRDRR